jgi:transposase
MNKRELAPVFKPYTQIQGNLLPRSYDELIPANHPVRIVNRVMDSLDLSKLIANYPGGGASSYHPLCLLKVITYGYLRNIYSSRQLEESLKDNIHFMWLSGEQKPDHNTIARFRSGPLKESLREIFAQIVQLLVAEGFVTLKQVFVDGTKIEATSNRYTFVWGKAIQTNKERILKQVKELMDHAEMVNEQESKQGDFEFKEISAEKIQETLEEIEKKLADKKVPQKVRQKLNYAKKNWPKNLEKYAEQQDLLAGRNSYSKTDTDATFMRTKDDHMGNGQLKPCYNVQISTENQFVTNFTLHQNPTDTKTLVPHLQAFKETNDCMPQELIADAGYGSEENLSHLEKNGIDGYVKYNSFHKEMQKGLSEFAPEKWKRGEKPDTLVCPNASVFELKSGKERNQGGYKVSVKVFENNSCEGCRFKENCNPNKESKRVEISFKLQELRKQARERLTSERGVELRKRRCHEVETVFGNIKGNHSFKRFLMRGLEKVSTEWGLLCIAQNIRKMSALAIG